MEHLAEALKALASYDYGSSRAALRPIDEAANGVFGKRTEQARLEGQLLTALSGARSVPARQYVCAILARIGSEKSVPALAAMLQDAAVSSSARTALESIACAEALKALRKALRDAEGANRVGLLNSLGVCRDASAIGLLVEQAAERDSAVAEAAIAALGEIGTRKAGQALLKVAGSVNTPGLADAMLTCAEQLQRDGESGAASRLLAALNKREQPQYIRDAIARAPRRAS